jgi:MHS family proline/betaine transporter-like MFS transporter
MKSDRTFATMSHDDTHSQADSGGHAVQSVVTNKKAIVSAVIGNWFEFFDFTVYGFFAIIIGKAFFPTGDGTTSLLLSVATFAVGFFTRPLGSIVLGIYADRRGRKAALTLTISLMALGTAGLAFTPTYAQIGIAAPIIIVLARLVQGFSQGGEFGAATTMLVENGSPDHRGFRAALLGAGAATAVNTLLPVSEVMAWGWRVPFVVGLLIAPVGIYLRRNLAVDTGSAAHTGFQRGVLAELFGQHKRTLVLLTLTVMGGTVSTYILNFYMPTYAIHTLGLPAKLSQWISVGSGTLMMLTCPLFGAWSDRMRSRKRPLLIGRTVLLLLLYPAFWTFNHFPMLPVVLSVTPILIIFYSMGSASEFSLMTESFPKRVRATGISIAYAISVTVFGGTSQLVATWLLKVTGNHMAPAWYVGACVLISLFAISQLRETAGKTID